MRPVICMITDRRRVGGNIATLVRQVGRAAQAGVELVQVRERDLEGNALTELVAGCVSVVRGTRTRIIVNDRLDVALACGAHGLHLRGDSFAAGRARAITPAGFLVGRSVHSADDVRRDTRAGSLDYLMFGTVFSSASKPGCVATGAAVLAEITRLTSLPVLAVGGITLENAANVAQAGAAGIAAIGLFAAEGADVAATMASLRRAFVRGPDVQSDSMRQAGR